MTHLDNLERLNARRKESPWAERVASQLSFLNALSAIDTRISPDQVDAAVRYALFRAERDGAFTAQSVRETEAMLADLAPIAKEYRVLYAAHAHIDMNWMWGYQETAAVVIDTLRTILDLMEEFPAFTYTQSQAAIYEIVEKLRPDMLDEIRARVREGRWEVAACQWVESDHNLPNGESLTRQTLQSRKYLSRLLGIEADSLDLCFIPDTFGHNANLPEILSDAGVRYMYHCRGHEGAHLYNFVSPSGKQVLAYREYDWYNLAVAPNTFEYLPGFCSQYGGKTALTVYGVGDHGGGPTRRDIRRIQEYASWPLTPTIAFGTLHDFFHAVEDKRVAFPVLQKEINYLFTGCYTTQARIKMASRLGEARMNECEALMAGQTILTGQGQNAHVLDEAWRKLLFNDFHDILPGSGTVETREFALGRFQEAMSVIGTHSAQAARAIADKVDTRALPFAPEDAAWATGGGAGYGQGETERYALPAAERGSGAVRAFVLLNPTPYKRRDTAEITVWDYPGSLERARVTGPEGDALPFAVSESTESYWGHHFVKLYVQAPVPAYGYTTVTLRPDDAQGVYAPWRYAYERNDSFINDDPIVLENALLRAVFDSRTMRLLSLMDKEEGKERLSAPACFFCLAHENPIHRLTAWRVGPTMQEIDLNQAHDVRLLSLRRNALETVLRYELRFLSSLITATVTLREGSASLEFALQVDWNELPVREQYIPQLSFRVPTSGGKDSTMLCDIPYGVLERQQVTHDVPCLSYIAVPDGDRAVALMADTKYGFRCAGSCAAVTLIRSAYDPDPYPDRGIHNIRLAVTVAKREALPRLSALMQHPVYAVSTIAHEGTLPLSGSALTVEGGAVSCIKPAENGRGIAVRVCDLAGKDTVAVLRPARRPSAAYMTDSNECHPCALPVSPDGAVKAPLPAFAVVTVVLEM